MTGRRLRAALVAVLGCASLAAAPAPHSPATKTSPATTPADEMAVSHGQVMIGGKPLRYTARAGLLPLYDNDTGALIARMFIVAYTADRAPEARRAP